uniref:Putative secreted protein n=1 Tax=Ixodes ricinus TaxID=34613 RepID=A0A6B0UJ85_IXORI
MYVLVLARRALILHPCLPTISATCSELGTGTHSVVFWLFFVPRVGFEVWVQRVMFVVQSQHGQLEGKLEGPLVFETAASLHVGKQTSTSRHRRSATVGGHTTRIDHVQK